MDHAPIVPGGLATCESVAAHCEFNEIRLLWSQTEWREQCLGHAMLMSTVIINHENDEHNHDPSWNKDTHLINDDDDDAILLLIIFDLRFSNHERTSHCANTHQ